MASLAAQTFIYSPPLGFNSVPCLAQADTILGVPFRPNNSQAGALSALPGPTDPADADYRILTLAGSPGFAVDEFATNNPAVAPYSHYVKFTSGSLEDRVFPITGNDASTLTIYLNGDSVSGAAIEDTLVIAAFWTLDTLFPPAEATTTWTEDPVGSGNWKPDGHAIVVSANPFARQTEIWLPNLSGAGINLAPNQTFYIFGGHWRKFPDYTIDYGDTIFYPDTYFIVRHQNNVTKGTTFKCSGEVVLGGMDIPVSTSASGQQDNFIGLPRPIGVKLKDLGLVPDAFVASINPFDLRDQLMVFDNDLAAFNKAPSVTYYYWNDHWRKFGPDYNSEFDDEEIPAGAGFMIRKAATATGATVFWKNPPNYSNDP